MQSEISEYQEKEDVICRLQSETKKYLWFSIDKNLVHSAIVSWDFWESIGGKINSPMDHQVGTAMDKVKVCRSSE